MQTMPPFVYLIPVVMLLGIGRVPGFIATTVAGDTVPTITSMAEKQQVPHVSDPPIPGAFARFDASSASPAFLRARPRRRPARQFV
jgi:hypothetical protein